MGLRALVVVQTAVAVLGATVPFAMLTLLAPRSTQADPLATTPAWIYESDQANALLGWSVSNAGDVNGDGYADVIVSARLYDNPENGEGRAYVFLGSSSGLSASPAWTAESNVATAAFGHSVSEAGDVNGDGYDDVIIGAPILSNGQNTEGRVYVYLGSASGLGASPAWTVESNQALAQLGFSVGTAGDVNGDGYDDVIVGAYQYENAQSTGRAWVYLGSAAGLDSVAAWTAEGDSTHFGYSVASAGDVNGDGYGDVIVGLVSVNGRARVYLGSASGLATTAVWTGVNAAVGFPHVAGAGDLNGDGYSDVIVGNRLTAAQGAAFVFLGSASGPSASADWVVDDVGGAQFGESVSSAGDVNADGYGDVIVGAFTFTDGQSSEGAAFAYLGSASGLDTMAVWTAQSDSTNALFGCSVSTAGDVNGDGFSDVVVGARTFASRGRAYVYHGGPYLPDQPPVVSGPADEAVEAGAALSFTVTASDPDSDPIASLTADLSALPPGNNATFVADGTNTSGVFTWNPSPATTGTYAVTFIAGNALADTLATTIKVTPFGATIHGRFDWTPGAEDVGPNPVTFKARSADGDSSSATTTINVMDLPPGSAPSPQFAPMARLAAMMDPVVSAPMTVDATVGTTVVFDVYATGADSLSCDTTALPAGNDATFTVDHEPVLVAPDIRGVDPGTLLTFTVTASDPDGDPLDTLAVDLSGLPPGNDATFVVNETQTSGLFSWTPGLADAGNFAVNFKAANRLVNVAITVVSVGHVDRPPTVDANGPSAQAFEGSLFQLTVTASDPDGDAIGSFTADLSGLPAGHDAAFAPNGTNTEGVLTWTPTYADAGTYPVKFVATNALADTAETVVSVENVVIPSSIVGTVSGDCPQPGAGLLGVTVDAYEVGSGTLVGNAVTDENGNYTITALLDGDYVVTIVPPLGYTTGVHEATVHISVGQGATVSFPLQCVQVTAAPRSIGFWKHQVGVATGGRGTAQVDAVTLCGHLDQIEAHFNSNAINQVVVYEPPVSGACPDKLQVAKSLLNLHGSEAMISRARQQLMALLLNVAAGYIGLNQVVSADGATLSQAITYADHVVDDPQGAHEAAKTLCDQINNGTIVPAGVIPLSTEHIAYSRGKGSVRFAVTPNPSRSERTFTFVMPRAARVNLSVYDVAGRVVARLLDGDVEEGGHSVVWNGRTAGGGAAARGVYVARLRTSDVVATLKVLQLDR